MLQVLTTLTNQKVSADYDTVRVPDGALCNPPFTFVFTIMNIYRVPYGNSQAYTHTGIHTHNSYFLIHKHNNADY